MIGADALLKSLENHGVSEIFAYPGGAVLPIYDRMPTYGIRRILVRHEQAAAFAAAGFSRACQKVGVCLATSGPGATNLVTGIADAKMDSVPMVVITGNVFQHLIGSDAFQEIDIVGICEPIVKHSYFVETAADLPRILSEAFHLAASGRPGPVLIDIPKSVQIEKIDPQIWQKIQNKENFEHDLPGYQPKKIVRNNQAEIQNAADLIAASRRPVAIIGHGAVLSNAEKAVQKFLHQTQIPSVWTLHGIGVVDPFAPRSLGMLGMHGTGAANFAVHNADLVISIGSRFDDRITGDLAIFQKDKKFIHFDIDPAEFDKNVKIHARIEGEILENLPQITEKCTEINPAIFDNWNKILDTKQKKWPLEKSGKMTEISVLNQIFAKMKKDAVVAVDVGQHQMWAAQRFPSSLTRKFLTSGGLGSMGFSLPSAMGAAFAGFETWSISGDGGFQMNCQELATLVQDKIPVKIIILNNSFLGMVRQWQEMFYGKNYVDTPLQNPDFFALGKAFGIPSFRAETSADCESVLEKMKNFNDGPILAEMVVEREMNVFPMVPAGSSLGETMLDVHSKIDNLDPK